MDPEWRVPSRAAGGEPWLLGEGTGSSGREWEWTVGARWHLSEPWYSEPPALVGFLGLGPYVCAEAARFGGIRITKGCEISNSVFIQMEIRI